MRNASALKQLACANRSKYGTDILTLQAARFHCELRFAYTENVKMNIVAEQISLDFLDLLHDPNFSVGFGVVRHIISPSLTGKHGNHTHTLTCSFSFYLRFSSFNCIYVTISTELLRMRKIWFDSVWYYDLKILQHIIRRCN